MALFTTTLQAIDPSDGQLKLWQGPHIEAISFNDAQQICNQTERGYLKVEGKLQFETTFEGEIILDQTFEMN
jgi:hypothetical protein